MKRNVLPLLIASNLLLGAAAIADPAPTASASEIHSAIRKLDVLGSVLYLAAHPDDENTRFLAYCAKGKLLRTGYLSLNRGEGGQNLIGPEQSSLLGVIRTWELLRARQLDGAEQFFTRAVDFGYSKSPEESLEKWGREQVLGDVVWVIRNFRPDIIVTRFSPTEGGHGHHLASGILAREAFVAAADSTRFPEQLKHAGVWKARRMYWNAFRPQDRAPDSTLIDLDVGTFNPVLGRSYAEIAALSRNNHKSQGFGTKPVRGSEIEKFKLTAGEGGGADLFAGLDLGWSKVKGGNGVSSLVKKALAAFDFKNPGEVMPILLQVRMRLAAMPPGPWVDVKLKETDAIIASLMGLWIEAAVETPSAVPGSVLPLEIKAVARALPGWTLERIALPGGTDTLVKAPLAPNRPFTLKVPLTLAAAQAVTHPYWLEGVLDSAGRNMYKVDDLALLGKPDAGPALEVELTLKHKYGPVLKVKAPVEHAYLDKVRGEIFQPFVVAPAATATFIEKVQLFPDGKAREVSLLIRNHGDSARGAARLRLPQGWASEPESRRFDLKGRFAEERVSFKVKPAAGDFRGRLGAEILLDGGQILDRAYERIDYGHIPSQTLFPKASTEAVKTDIRAGRQRVGYVMGAGDMLPGNIRQMGYPVTVLNEGDLDGDLGRFDVLITGVRSHNTRKDLGPRRAKIMEWVKHGGRLIVQYNVNTGLLTEEPGPYPFKLSRDRVTVEEAPLKVLEPSHPFFTGPNRLGPADFGNWVQERGLYFAGEWDPRYKPLLEGNDPGEKPSKGILLFAQHGKGTFVYTGLSLFRQLPAGVPGAYRLMANLISAKVTDAR